MNVQDTLDLQRDQEIVGTQDQAHDAHLEGRLLDLHTAMPGTIVSYDKDSQTCSVRPAARRLFLTGPDPGFKPVPVLVDVPVQFPAGGAGVLTFPVSQGDECLLVFCERSIDEWYQLGGTQVPSYRLHDLSDAVAIVGISSRPRHLTSVSATATELRTRDGLVRLQLDETGVRIVGNLTVTGGVVIEGVVAGAGAGAPVQFSDPIQAPEINAGTVALSSHVHPQTGGPDTGPPVP